jgi:PAS domain-containing protein
MARNDDRLLTGREHASALPTEHLLATFSASTTIGFGICDRELRYQYVNDALALSNGIAAEEHVGRTLRDVLGATSVLVEPTMRDALLKGPMPSRQVVGRVPNRRNTVYWICSYFPAGNYVKQAKEVCGLAIDVTQLGKLDEFCASLRRDLRSEQQGENFRIARELQDSIREYFRAVTDSIEDMAKQTWRCDSGSDDLLKVTIELLDKRLAAVSTLVNLVSKSLSLDARIL